MSEKHWVIFCKRWRRKGNDCVNYVDRTERYMTTEELMELKADRTKMIIAVAPDPDYKPKGDSK